MKQDEIDLMLGKKIEMHPKRRKFILNKWASKGWGVAPNYTETFLKIKSILSKEKRIDNNLDGQVVVMHSTYYPPMIGILEDHGDNGWHLYTSKSIKKDWSYYVGESRNLENHICYFEPHPNPRKIFNKLNYLAWKYLKRQDRFHKKISEWDYDSIRPYRIEDGQFVWLPPTNPNGNIGDCRSYCQCKRFSI